MSRPLLCFVLTAWILLCLTACGGGTGQQTSPKAEQQEAGEDYVSETDRKKWGGWRWKGNRKKCYFVYKNRCFEEQKAACQAAKCKQSKCVTNGSAPAKVSCEK